MTDETWVSPRHIAEEARERRIRAFDAVMELVFDGTVTMDDAMKGLRTEVPFEQRQ